MKKLAEYAVTIWFSDIDRDQDYYCRTITFMQC